MALGRTELAHGTGVGGGPPARADLSIGALDGTVFMYAGIDESTQIVPYQDMWSWSAGVWKDTKATSGPIAPREGAAMARLGTKLFIFGGFTYDDVGSSNGIWMQETWAWDGQFWSQHMVPGPSARRNAAMAPLGGKLVLFGGSDSTGKLLGDTWEWDGNAWTQRMPPESPPGRAYHAMATLGSSVYLFGGDLNGNRTWEWDGNVWTHHDVLGPVPRVGAPMVTYGDKILLYGGQNAAGKYLSDTWEWNGTAWTQRKVQGPPGRTLHGLVAP